MIGLIIAALIPPVPVPPPWHPEREPEYSALCHASDVAGAHWSGRLDVTGQRNERVLSLKLDDGDGKSLQRSGKSVLTVLSQVTDGTYGFMETRGFDEGQQPLAAELRGLGPAPSTLFLSIRGPATSPAFEEPAMVGLCRVTSVKDGSKFVLAPYSKEPQ